jgi:hypothetical protein
MQGVTVSAERLAGIRLVAFTLAAEDGTQLNASIGIDF